MSDEKKKGINLVVESLNRAIDGVMGDRRAVIALYAYIHAFHHKQDPTAVASGLDAAHYLEKVDADLTTPADCLMGILISELGFTTVVSMSNEELATALDMMDYEVATKKAKEYIEADREKADRKKAGRMTEDEFMDAVMKQLPLDTTQH